MEHLWAKIKAYLDNRFGTGTINIDNASRINVNDVVQIHGFHPDTLKLTTSLKINLDSNVKIGVNPLRDDTDNYCMLAVGVCDGSGNVRIVNTLSESKTVKYVVVSSYGVKHGSTKIGSSSTTLISEVGDFNAPFIIALAI